MALWIHNTAGRKKEPFVPLEPDHVRMYVCGPTVYDFLHIGNFRGPIFFNLVRSWFERLGYRVTFVYNYTDVDDKIIARAQRDGVESSAVAEKYIAEFETDFKALGLKPHTHNPRVTSYIQPIVKIIQRLIENGHAYVDQSGEVLYSVNSFKSYGMLSGKNLDELQVGARVELGSHKQNPLDFVLWKPSKPGEPRWPSPWGDGRPGWHIECSAMSSELLGDTFDIHGGGIDLIFPHHENELAQSEGASHKHPFVKFWMHNNFINFGSQKMSKSLGNITTARSFLKQYNAEILKYMFLCSHYRTHSDFSQAQIDQAVSGLARIYSAMSLAEDVLGEKIDAANVPTVLRSASAVELTQEFIPFGAFNTISGISAEFRNFLIKASQGIETALNDDFNTPEMLARIFEVTRFYNGLVRRGQKVSPESKASSKAFLCWIQDCGEMLSLFREPKSEFLRRLDDMLLEQKNLSRPEVDQLVAERAQARIEKKYELGDQIRARLVTMGIQVHDGPQGSQWEVQK